MHTHPCHTCNSSIECDGKLESNHDGWPETICPEYLLPGGVTVEKYCSKCTNIWFLENQIVRKLEQVYNDCGPDLGWVNQAPEDEEFVDVLCNLVYDRLNINQLEHWNKLSRDRKQEMCLEVGP